MNFANERWRKLYIRATAHWRMLSWEARSVWRALLTEVDDEGRIDVGKFPQRAVAEVIKSPLSVVEAAWAELIAHDEGEDPMIRLDGKTLVMVNFQDAQESRQSNALRCRRYRERQVTVTQNVSLPTQDMSIATQKGSVSTPFDHERHTATHGDTIRIEETREKREKRSTTTLASLVAPSAEQVKSPPRTRRERGVRITDNWAPTDQTCAVVRALGLDPVKILSAFRDHWAADGSDRAWKVNWDAAFRQWARKDLEFRNRPGVRFSPATNNPAHRPFVPPPIDLPSMTIADAENQVELWMNGRGKH